MGDLSGSQPCTQPDRNAGNRRVVLLKWRLAPALLLPLAFLFGLAVGCSGGASLSSSPPRPVSVSVAPGAVSVAATATQQFSAAVSGTSNVGVTWSLSGAGCSGPACGTLSSTTSNPVTYTAPTGVPSPATVSVTATAQADSSKSASATVTITPPPIAVSVSPGTATVVINGAQEFTASVTGTANMSVTWSLSGTACAGTACGTLSSTTSTPVIYTAPPTAPSPATVSLTATAQADPSKSASTTITIATSNNFKLKGQYAFLFTGFDAGGPMAAAGSFMADGDGNLTNGVQDITRNSGVPNVQNVSFTGSYSLGLDHRGTFTFTNLQGASTFRFALQSNGDAHFVEFDASGTRGAGVLKKQDAAAFSTSAINGDFALAFGGSFLGSSRIGAVGRFHTDGTGNLSSGKIDVSVPGSSFANLDLTGSYSVGSNGRGTATLNALVPSTSGVFNFSFYVVSAGEMYFVSADAITALAPVLSGMVLQQSGGPFTLSSLSGASVFHLTGLDPNTGSSNTAVGLLAVDGAGNLTGVLDRNTDNVVVVNHALSGLYNVSPNGRGTLGLTSAESHAIYMIRSNKAFILEGASLASGTDVALGLIEPQAAGPFDNNSLAGNYVLGTLAPVTADVAELSGAMAADGLGNISGTVDESGPSGLVSDQALAAAYAAASNGRGTLTASPATGSLGNLIFWMVSPGKVVMISADPSQAHTAVLVLEK